MKRAIARRAAVPLAVAATLGVAAIGAMHLRAARPLLEALGFRCPAVGATADQVTLLRKRGWSGLGGDLRAPGKPAPAGLVLDMTDESDAIRWASSRQIDCAALARGYRYLRCRGFDAAKIMRGGPPVSEMWLSFNARGKLEGVDVYRRGMNAEETRIAWSGATSVLHHILGSPTSDVGDANPAVLLASPVQTARILYRYSDYVAIVTASHLPGSGLAVREQYMVASNP
ncbi:hypothetical protein LGM43_14885 [Burkholderia seminalis]|uniref:hypothetical protein n=1 Tax=Burkholderia seminalis TaxID=488731 RepID=UPI001CF26B3D|nr:hypothetical protein [Burkholderia seminalis]MCA7951551.1 hypothetical protein [Burkholderia seminalis]